MGQGERIERINPCPLTPSPKIGLSTTTVSIGKFVATSLIIVLSMAAFSTYPVWAPALPLPSHAPIAIDGDASFSATAHLEGWPGDGSPGNPYIIDGLDIDLGSELGNCIDIRNTRVSFTISNCNLTRADGSIWWSEGEVGIYLENVINGELVNNTCTNNGLGIYLLYSDSNTVANNTCSSNFQGITLYISDSNTVTDNTCNSNGREADPGKNGEGISIYCGSDSNTVTDNTCNNNDQGIVLAYSDSNTLANNTCNNNSIHGIVLEDEANHNTIANNTCNDNRIGIFLFNSTSNTVVNNTCLGNTEHDIIEENPPDLFSCSDSQELHFWVPQEQRREKN